MSATMTTTIQFAPTPEGVAAARLELDELEGLFGADDDEPETEAGAPDIGPPGPGPHTDDNVAQLVYNGANDEGRTRDLLKALPGDDEHPLTFAELGELMRPWPDGTPLAAPEVRACHRNEKRIERTLKKRGVISEERVVIHQEWDRAQGIGRYYVSAADRDVLQSL